MKTDEITQENLNLKLQDATSKLLEMARNLTWNKISNNVKFLIKKVRVKEAAENLFEEIRIRKKLLNSKEKLNLDTAVNQLNLEFENIYLIDLYIFKADKKETIVEIEVLEKSELDIEYRKTILDNPPMLHCKVAMPPYIGFEKKKEFDINWQLETIEYKWEIFFWRIKHKLRRFLE